MNDAPDRRSIHELLSALSQDLGLLLTQTLNLARAEVRAATSALAISMVGLAIGAFVALVGALVLVSALVLIAIALGLPPWAAATVVGVVLTGAGLLIVRLSIVKLRRVHFDLRETRRSVTETLAWLKAQT